MSARLLIAIACGLLLGACSKPNTIEAAATTTPASAAPIAGANTAGAHPAGPAAPLPPGTLRMQRVEIPDPGGFERPLVAIEALVPAGWKSSGGIVWSPFGTCGSDYGLNWTTTAPDGVTAVGMLPAPTWSAVRSNYPQAQPSNCPQAEFTTAEAFLQDLVRRNYPQARVLAYAPRPDLAKPVQDTIASIGSMNSELVQSELRADAGAITIAYERNGQRLNEQIVATVMINYTRLADVMNPGQVSMETLQGTPLALAFSRAPEGKLDQRLVGIVANSFRQRAEWSQRIHQFQMTKAANNQQAMTARHNARMDALRTTAAISNGAYEDRMLMSDRQQRETIESIRGVETYNDPVAGAPVQLDNTYDHAWRVNDGTYVLTNDASFDPGRYGLEGQQLTPVP